MDKFLALERLEEGSKIHFIGIGGSSMSGLARILIEKGYTVSGSDSNSSNSTSQLERLGAKIYKGHDRDHLPSDCKLVVYTLAIAEDNPEYLKAKKDKIPIIERGLLLGYLTKDHKYSICVAGTHGKTTTTSMISYILLEANLDPTIHMGGNLPKINGNVKTGHSEYLITEACEYHDNFLNLDPYVSLVLNVARDHLDYFKTVSRLKKSFLSFLNLTKEGGFSVVCGENKRATTIAKKAKGPVYFYGLSKDLDFWATDIEYSVDSNSFSIYEKERFAARIKIQIYGEHNVLNALASWTVCRKLGIDEETIKKGLESFLPPARRFEKKGKINGALIIDDYAHHPDEIARSLESARQINDGRIFSVFQPHTYTRAKKFKKAFAKALKKSDQVIITDIYAAREKNNHNIYSSDLQRYFLSKRVNSLYMADFTEIATFLKEKTSPSDIILLLGAGDVNEIANLLLS